MSILDETVKGNYRRQQDLIKKLYEGIVLVADAVNTLSPAIEEAEKLLKLSVDNRVQVCKNTPCKNRFISTHPKQVYCELRCRWASQKRKAREKN